MRGKRACLSERIRQIKRDNALLSKKIRCVQIFERDWDIVWELLELIQPSQGKNAAAHYNRRVTPG